MSFAEAIAALRNLFNLSAELPLAAAVDEMRSVMCIEALAVRDHYYIYALDREAVAVWSVGCGFLGVRECVVLISYLKSAKIRSEFLNATVS